MVTGVRLASASNRRLRKRLCAATRYYWPDLLHAWAEHLLFLGKPFRRITKRAYGRVTKEYDRVHRKHPDFMEWEYFWMRHQEARLLAGTFSIHESQAFLERIQEIQDLFEMIQHHTQRGNPDVYRALHLFVTAGESAKADIERLLDKAEEIWSGSDGGGVAMSGLFRVFVYRRYFGLPSFWRMVGRLPVFILSNVRGGASVHRRLNVGARHL